MVKSVRRNRCRKDGASDLTTSSPANLDFALQPLSWTFNLDVQLCAIEAKLIVVVTKKGRMARLVAKFRPNVPVRHVRFPLHSVFLVFTYTVTRYSPQLSFNPSLLDACLSRTLLRWD